jgi:nitroreductase
MYRPLAGAGIARRLVEAAGAAPSIHNTQPWRFRVAGDALLEIHGDPERMLWVADAHGRALHLSCGAALHDMRQSTGWWPWPECPQIILGLGYGPAGAGSPRRRVDDILDRAAGPTGTTA